MATLAYLALGSNLGDRRGQLRAAIARVGNLPGTTVISVAAFRETEPEGGPAGQGRYLNGAVGVETELPARALLQGMLAIERELGRDRARESRNGPRVVDLDLLLYGGSVIDEPGLTVPHPRMAQRRFVLEPLAEIAGTVRHPRTGQTAGEMLAALAAREFTHR